MTAPITKAEIEALEALAKGATPRPWAWWTSNSWRRLSSDARGHNRDGGVLCPTTSPSDGHPDCVIRQEDMAYIAAACNAVPRLIKALRLSRARESAMAAALKPFAEAGLWIPASEPNGMRAFYVDRSARVKGTCTSITMGDLRAAARVLADRDTAETGGGHDGLL